MISLTTYWRQFKDSIDNLQTSTQNTKYPTQILVARSLIQIGLSIEILGVTEMKQVVNQLNEKNNTHSSKRSPSRN